MGSPRGEPLSYDNEYPAHEVEITRPFYIAKTEVTVGQFRRFTEETNFKTLAEYPGNGGSGYDSTKKIMVDWSPEYNWRNPGFTQTEDHPVVLINWHDTQEFCSWLSKREGRRYRLPTEAEWEYACRAGSTTRFWWGDDEAGLQGKVNLADQSLVARLPAVKDWARKWDDGYPFTSPVGSFAPNPWGLYDMSGNALEWCQDWSGDYSSDSQRDPVGPGHGSKRILRGGFWNGGPNVCRSADRAWELPTSSTCYIGFRVAADAK
jgi:formylglycine-generating enzyme required for sulfatase activity